MSFFRCLSFLAAGLLAACRLSSIDELQGGRAGDAAFEPTLADETGTDGALRDGGLAPHALKDGGLAPPADQDGSTVPVTPHPKQPVGPADMDAGLLPMHPPGAPKPDASGTPAVDATNPQREPETEAGAPAPFACTHARANICTDFEAAALRDETTTLLGGFGWTEPATLDQARLGLEREGDDRVLRATLQPRAHDLSRLGYEFPSPLRRLHVEFDLKTPLPSSATARVELATFQHLAEDNYPGIALNAESDGIYLTGSRYDGSKTVDIFRRRVSGSLPGWVRVTLDLSFGAQGTVAVAYDGVSKLELSNVPLDSLDVDTSMFLLGPYSAEPLTFTVWYDDVSVEAE